MYAAVQPFASKRRILLVIGFLELRSEVDCEVMKYLEGQNGLLMPMPRKDRERFLADCEQVEMRFGGVLYERGERIRYAYFPLAGFISLIAELDDGAALEVGIVGDEGMLGTSLVLGIGVCSQRAVVQGAGTALRISAAATARHLDACPSLRRTLHSYIDVVMAQLAQTAACMSYHLVEARLARWLLLSRDRAHRDSFHLTHEFLAYMLGVRRVGVTQAAGVLQERGLIDYRRGDITLLDPARLEEVSCSCYARGKQIYQHALGARPNRGLSARRTRSA